MVGGLLLVFILGLLFLSGCSNVITKANNPYGDDLIASSAIEEWKPKKKEEQPLFQEINYAELENETSISLAMLLDIALKNNPETKKSWYGTRIAATDYGQSLKEYMPEVDLVPYAERIRIIQFLANNQRQVVYQEQSNLMAEIKYTILDFGQTTEAAKSLLEALYAANYLYNDQLLLVIKNVSKQYYAYISSCSLLEAAQANVNASEVALTIAKEKEKTGMNSATDVSEAETVYRKYRLELINQQQVVQESYSNLLNTIGLPSPVQLNIDSHPNKFITLSSTDLDKMLTYAQKNNPRLQAAYAKIRSKEASVLQAEYAKNRPKLNFDLMIGLGFYGSEHKRGYNYDGRISLAFPLFDGYLSKNQVKEAKNTLMQAKEELVALKNDLLKDITDSRALFIHAQNSIEEAKQYLHFARSDLNSTISQYREGMLPILNVIQSLATLADARQKVSEAEQQYFSSLANLAYNAGFMNLPNEEKK